MNKRYGGFIRIGEQYELQGGRFTVKAISLRYTREPIILTVSEDGREVWVPETTFRSWDVRLAPESQQPNDERVKHLESVIRKAYTDLVDGLTLPPDVLKVRVERITALLDDEVPHAE